jgi:hypothetical protein
MRRIVHLYASTLPLVVAAVSIVVPALTRADDDIKLKDGTKIIGTIVGFEDNSFKVKTSYGYALVEKDQVVSIIVANGSKAAEDKSSAAPNARASSNEKPKPEAAVSKATESQPSPVSNAKPVAASKNSPPPSTSAPAPNAIAAAPAVAENAAPSKPPEPEPIREQVTGNTYTNETYRFHMYKPPDWNVIASAPAVLPGAITAMGTPDDSTYLLIGQEPAGKSLVTDMDATERRLRNVLENFRSVGAEQITVSGTTAMEHRFRGSVDQHDWSGIVVLVERGQKLYTIFGMTRADNDLVQLQENVISRAISSLQFTN